MTRSGFNFSQLPPDTYIDCSDEATSVREIPADVSCWLGQDIATDQWFVPFSEAALAELHRAAAFITDHPVANMARQPADLELTECSRCFNHIKSILDRGVGFAVADRLPVDDYPLQTLVELYWILGQLIAPPVAQKRNGQMIYDVRDTNKQYSYGVRGSWTNVELNFHTDNAFGIMPPEYVGLFCRHPAKTGGISRFCSLYALHASLQKKHPAALQRLYEPMLYDRQKEHNEGEPPVTLAPFFSWKNNRLRARANPELVRKGYAVAQIEMESSLHDALAAVDKVSKEDEFWFEANLEKGQIQYLNNSEVGHYRSQFVDFEDEERKRHLFRLWHRSAGSVCYDGGTA